jgi:hypothetical protein
MDITAIDGITGPGRRTTMVLNDITEFTFKLKGKVFEVTQKNGDMGSFDLAAVSQIQVRSADGSVTFAITSRKKETDDDRIKQAEWRGEAIDLWTDTIADKSTRIGSPTAPTVKSDAGKARVGDFDTKSTPTTEPDAIGRPKETRK